MNSYPSSATASACGSGATGPRGGCVDGATPKSGWLTSWEEIYLKSISAAPFVTNVTHPMTWKAQRTTQCAPAGAEVCLWGETIDDYNIDNKLFPRGSAFAEVLWRDTNTLDNIPRVRWRLAHHREDLVRLGLRPNTAGEASVFRYTPWGARERSTPAAHNDLMADINSNQTLVPDGHLSHYKVKPSPIRPSCPNSEYMAVNPRCVDEIFAGKGNFSGMVCGSSATDYVQQGCV